MTDIGIVGAGIGGLAAGLALQRAGFVVRIYEQAPELGEIGAGLSLSPNAVKGLRYLGLEEIVERVADRPPQQLTRHFQTGEVLVNIDRADTPERYGAPYLQIHRADLHAILVAAVTAMTESAWAAPLSLAIATAATFHVYPVNHVEQALEILTGQPAGERGEDGEFPEGSVNRLVEDRLKEFAAARRAYHGAGGDMT